MHSINSSSGTFRTNLSVAIECTTIPRAILQSLLDANLYLFPPADPGLLIDLCSNVGLPQIEAARFIEDCSAHSPSPLIPALATAPGHAFLNVYGPSGSGKTRGCVSAVASSLGTCMSTAVWIDCDGSFSADLLLMSGIPLSSLTRLYVLRAYHWTELVSACNMVPLITPHCGALVVDSMSSLLRHELSGSFGEHCKRTALLTNLVKHLTTLNCSVILTNQMTTKFDDISALDGDALTPELSPCLGKAYKTALSAAGARDLPMSDGMDGATTGSECVYIPTAN